MPFDEGKPKLQCKSNLLLRIDNLVIFMVAGLREVDCIVSKVLGKSGGKMVNDPLNKVALGKINSGVDISKDLLFHVNYL